MEPTESAAPHSRLRRLTGAWREWAARTAERSRAERVARARTVPDGRTTVQIGVEPTAGPAHPDHERHLSWPALPASVSGIPGCGAEVTRRSGPECGVAYGAVCGT